MASELTPQTRGKWLVTTQGSRHVWDMDAMTYQRLPGKGRGAFAHDRNTVRITRVDKWPQVGEVFFLWFDDPEHPELLEHWRQSSRIESIELLTEVSKPEAGAQAQNVAEASETPES